MHQNNHLSFAKEKNKFSSIPHNFIENIPGNRNTKMAKMGFLP